MNAQEFAASGCLSGTEIRAEGKILNENRKPYPSYSIQVLTAENAKPIVIAKDLRFGADGSFKYKGNLPAGVKLSNTGDIKIVFGEGNTGSVYSGLCQDVMPVSPPASKPASLPATTPTFNQNSFYNLTPQYQKAKSLDVVNDGKNNQVQLATTGNFTGQRWKITPVQGLPGYYRLSPQFQPTKSLDVVNDGKNNQVQLVATGNFTGQYWKITPVQGQSGYFRLSPQFQPTKSLDVVNDGKNYNKVWLDNTGNWNGQFWKISIK